jgi:hypothetical protein
MATTIKLKNSVTTTNAPSSLAQGEVAINVTDKKVWVGNAATTPVQLLGTGADGSLSTLTVGAGTVSAPAITTTGDTNTGIFFPAADTIAFTEGGTEAMRIDSSGNVGIGTTNTAPANGTGLVVGSSGTIARIDMRNSTTGLASGDGTSFYLSGNDFTIENRETGFVAFATSLTERMRIDSGGNVGIGATSPRNSSRVTIDGTNDATSKISLYRSDTGSALQVGSNYIGTWSNSVFEFYTNQTERMRITSGGDLLVGATSQYGSEKLNVTSSSSANAARTINIYNSSASSTTKLNNVITRISSNGNGADNCINLTDNVAYNYYFGGNNGGAYVVASSNGVRLTVNSTSWSADSDERVKDIIEPITDAVNKVSSLRSVIGKYKTDEEGTRRSFLIAQDVQKVLPEAVCDEQGTLMLAYTDVIPLLVAAIKEQQAIITDLKSRITALENK